jgi:hypothetical protein
MGTLRIVILSPALDHDRCFVAGREPLAIQTFVAKFTVKTFDEAILPRMPGRNEAGADLLVVQPLLDSAGRKLAAMIRAQELWRTIVLHGALQQRDMNRQTFASPPSRLASFAAWRKAASRIGS